jgi:hypothetical protein
MSLLKLYASLVFGIVCCGVTINIYNVMAYYKSAQIITSDSNPPTPTLIDTGSTPPMFIATGSKQKPPMLINATIGDKTKLPANSTKILSVNHTQTKLAKLVIS